MRNNLEKGFMRHALRLAKNGEGYVNPNPLVGALLVKDGEIIAEGWHERFGGPHAERNAFSSCKVPMKGATLYVNLEPCCHSGKTLPCTDLIIESGVARVVVGVRDPNPLVAGKSIKLLREQGIEVIEGILAEECIEINKVFFHYIKTGMPYVKLKYAMTMDGKIASGTGESKWITGEAARQRVHFERNRCAAVMVGVGTVLADDPMLNCRIEGGKNPLRVICDSHLRTPMDSNLVESAREIPTVIATISDDAGRRRLYEDKGCDVRVFSQNNGHVDLVALITGLGKDGIDSILIEGGGELNYTALKCGVVNAVQCYIAPKVLGGRDAVSPVGGSGFIHPDQSVKLKNTRMTQIGPDFLLEGEVDK